MDEKDGCTPMLNNGMVQLNGWLHSVPRDLSEPLDHLVHGVAVQRCRGAVIGYPEGQVSATGQIAERGKVLGQLLTIIRQGGFPVQLIALTGYRCQAALQCSNSVGMPSRVGHQGYLAKWLKNREIAIALLVCHQNSYKGPGLLHGFSTADKGGRLHSGYISKYLYISRKRTYSAARERSCYIAPLVDMILLRQV